MSMIPSNILDLLQEQYKHETKNYLRYLVRASWARYRGLEGAGDFFEKEADGEKAHAEQVRKYIEDRNEALNPIGLVYDEPANFGKFIDIFQTALAIERETTERLSTIHAEAMKAMDLITAIWVQPLIYEQIEEENLYTTALDRFGIRGVDIASDHDIDCWIASRLKG